MNTSYTVNAHDKAEKQMDFLDHILSSQNDGPFIQKVVVKFTFWGEEEDLDYNCSSAKT